MHQTGLIDEEKNKPKIVCFYNKTKCGVDLMDMKCATYTSNRRTRRWPLAIFYRILNVCSVNSFIIFLCYTGSPVTTRFSFIKELSKELIEPHLRRRLAIPNIPCDIKEVVKKAPGDGKNERPHGVPDDRLKKKKTAANVLTSNKGKQPMLASNVPDRFVLNAVEKNAQIVQ